MMREKGMKLAAVCLTGLLIVGSVPNSAEAAKKVTIKGKKKVTMNVGAKKKFTANQKVKWTVKGKSIKIIKGKSAKTVTVQAKKKGTSTLTAKKGKKKVSVTVQVKSKTTGKKDTATNNNTDNSSNNNTNNNISANITDMTKLTSESFYKVTKVSGNNITVVSEDNKEYTTTAKSDIPIWRKDAVVQPSAIQPGEYFRCCPFSFAKGNEKVTTYAALVITEFNYQYIQKRRNEGDKNYTMSAATVYIISEGGKNSVDLAGYANGEKIANIYVDEDTAVVVNGETQYSGGKLQTGMRILLQYGWENPEIPGNLVNVNSLVAY